MNILDTKPKNPYDPPPKFSLPYEYKYKNFNIQLFPNGDQVRNIGSGDCLSINNINTIYIGSPSFNDNTLNELWYPKIKESEAQWQTWENENSSLGSNISNSEGGSNNTKPPVNPNNIKITDELKDKWEYLKIDIYKSLFNFTPIKGVEVVISQNNFNHKQFKYLIDYIYLVGGVSNLLCFQDYFINNFNYFNNLIIKKHIYGVGITVNKITDVLLNYLNLNTVSYIPIIDPRYSQLSDIAKLGGKNLSLYLKLENNMNNLNKFINFIESNFDTFLIKFNSIGLTSYAFEILNIRNKLFYEDEYKVIYMGSD